MKINSNLYLNNPNINYENINIIFLYGTNIGLIELLYEKSLNIFKIDVNDPFNVSKIRGEELIDNPSILFDNINTISMFSTKRHILLDLMQISVTKNIEKIILEAIEKGNNNYLLLIKSQNLKKSAFLNYFQNLKNSFLVSCYEEKLDSMYSKISNILSKHNVNFDKDFINKITHKLNSDSLSNKMEIDKLDTFLTNNNNVTEEMILTLISKNVDLNLNKVIEYCTKGNATDALTYFENAYENQNTSITLIRMFVNHFKLIEKILLLVQDKKNLIKVVENIKPPIFFKNKEFIIFQCKVWNLKLIKIIQTRLIELELKSKLNQSIEKTLLCQFLLSTSVLAKNRIRT